MRAKRQRRFGPFAVLIRPDERSGVAQTLVDFPTFPQVPVTEVPEVFAELCLVFVKGKRAWLPHNRLELVAQRGIAGNLSGLLFVRASGRRRALHACKHNQNGRERCDRTARAPNARNVTPQKHLETCPRYSGWHRAIPRKIIRLWRCCCRRGEGAGGAQMQCRTRRLRPKRRLRVIYASFSSSES